MPGPDKSLLSADDLYLFNEGSHLRLYEKLGAHMSSEGGQLVTRFAVWAPDAGRVSVVGDFNGWRAGETPLQPREVSGIWEGALTGLEPGAIYKFHVTSRQGGYSVEKADPFAFFAEQPPRTGSRLWRLEYDWHDADWLQQRQAKQSLAAPVSIYEVHLGSWRRRSGDGGRVLTYRELAEPLAAYVKQLGFSHVEFMPVMEHPFYGSWGYQTTGYFAPTSRYGTPQDFMYLVDYLHQQGIGVILDWVPSHFPTDQHGLGYFDGTHLYEHASREQGFHPDWGSLIFNYGRNEVRSFLLSGACFWLDKYHVDGLRVDAVASMLYLDYSRKAGEWVPNRFGGRENLDAVDFLRRLNIDVHGEFPGVLMVAEESTAWPMVSRPTYVGGLGFDLKWDMGWMHDTLEYFRQDPIYRQYHHGEITFRQVYAGTENFVLALSHDEVVHGKGSLLDKMPGDDWQKFANLRLLLSYMYAQNGKKLLFMGMEFGQWREWRHDESLDWHLAQYDRHAGIQKLVSDLNDLYRSYPAMHELDCEDGGFRWLDAGDYSQSVLTFLRFGRGERDLVLAALNFTPVPRRAYRVGAPFAGVWREVLNSDSSLYGGGDVGNGGAVVAEDVPHGGYEQSLQLVLPPLGAVFLVPA